MLWLTWRQHRAELVAAIILLAAIGVLLLVSGISMHRAFDAEGVAACLGRLGDGRSTCGEIVTGFSDRYIVWGDLLTWLNLLPGLAGVFVGAPLLGRELEDGTWKFAFTQSVTRTRWLTIKLTAVGLVVVALAAAFTALFTWWRAPLDAIEGRIASGGFNFEGLSLASGALFSLAVGVFAGALLRRTVPAMAVSLLGYFAVRTPIELYARPRYETPLLRIVGSDERVGPSTTNWVLSQGWINAEGEKLSRGERNSLLGQVKDSGTNLDRYMRDNGLRQYVEYQPDERFWHFQIIEAALLLGLTALLMTLSIWLIRRRTT